MMIPGTHGLTPGKFAPLHRGHQYLIETALREMEQMTVLIYDAPATTTIPLPVRAGWLRQLYPSVRVIEAWDGPEEVGDTPDIRQRHEDYILHRLKIRGITHFYSSEFYGDHMSRALHAVNRLVDVPRQAVPISGTLIRADPYRYREYVPPLVYRDLVTRVVFLGAPATGKTTLAQHMARQLDTVWMPEYGREYWEAHQVNRRLTQAQLVEIAEEHRRREDDLLLQARRYLFVDTNAITTYMFGLAYHGAVLPRLAELAQQAAARYDLVFVCDTDIPYADTWDRSGEAERAVFQKQIVADLRLRGLPFFTLRGEVAQRAQFVRQVLARHQRYQNWLDTLWQPGEE
jgi:NadR type nicotinamide-nucleotide adenylyltransferase